jgi:hypothetical protein
MKKPHASLNKVKMIKSVTANVDAAANVNTALIDLSERRRPGANVRENSVLSTLPTSFTYHTAHTEYQY